MWKIPRIHFRQKGHNRKRPQALGGNFSEIALRCSGWDKKIRLRLHKYDIIVKYRPEKELLLPFDQEFPIWLKKKTNFLGKQSWYWNAASKKFHHSWLAQKEKHARHDKALRKFSQWNKWNCTVNVQGQQNHCSKKFEKTNAWQDSLHSYGNWKK